MKQPSRKSNPDLRRNLGPDSVLEPAEGYKDVLNLVIDEIQLSSQFWELLFLDNAKLVCTNQMAFLITGFQADDFYSNNQMFFSLFDLNDRERLNGILKIMPASNKTEELECKIKCSNREIKWLRLLFLPVYAKDCFLGTRVSITDITKYIQEQLAINKILDSERLVSAFATSFLSSGDYNTRINNGLEIIGSGLSSDRVFVALVGGNGAFATVEYLWEKRNNAFELPLHLKIDLHDFLEMHKTLSQTKNVFVLSSKNVDAKAFQGFVDAFKMESALLYPLYFGTGVKGFFCIERFGKKSVFTNDEKLLCQTISLLLSKVLNRMELKKQWIESHDNFKNLFEQSSEAIFVVNLRGRIIEVNQTACELLEYKRDELIGKTPVELTNQERGTKPEKIWKEITQSQQLLFGTELVSQTGKIIPIETKDRVIDFFNHKAIMVIARVSANRLTIERQIIQTMVETEERERKRFAEDLHDNLAPLLSAVKLLNQLVHSGKLTSAEKQQAIDEINSLIDDSVELSRQIANNINPTILSGFGLCTSINYFCKKINQTKKIELSFDPGGYKINCNQLVEKVLYSVVSELVHNTLKHSGASKGHIELKNDEKFIYFVYTDNGKGFDSQTQLASLKGNGLKNIVGKVKGIAGSCTFTDNYKPGFCMEIKVPVNSNSLKI